MRTEFVRANVRKEIGSLKAFDSKLFSSDAFGHEDWKAYRVFWLLVQGKKVGCCAFEENVDFTEDLNGHQTNTPMKGSLYIATTGIRKDRHGEGLGELLKAWEIAYAKHHGFTRLVTNTRKSNVAMIELNQKYKFKPLRLTEAYYDNPIEATIVMERPL